MNTKGNEHGWKRKSHNWKVRTRGSYAYVMSAPFYTGRKNELKRLKKLQRDLLNLGNVPDTSTGIIKFGVKFMNLMSFFQDEGLLQYQPVEKDELVAVFNTLIDYCGRQPGQASWNQSSFGEHVTLDNVYFGGVWGLPIKPARYWLSCSRKYQVLLTYHSAALASPPKVHIPKDYESLQKIAKSKDVVKSETLWATDALVLRGPHSVERFVKKNYDLTIAVLEKILNQ